MSYKKYYLYKKQVSTDGGQTWEDVQPIETIPSGDPISDYDSEESCEASLGYLTFVAQESGTFTFNGTSGNENKIQYSLDSGTTWTRNNTVSVSSGDKVMWKGELSPNATLYGIGQFVSTNRFEAEGNPMSLLFGSNFNGSVNLSNKEHAFSSLFMNCTKLTSINNLSLPATILSNYCYENMFAGCTSLPTIPSGLLPATTLAERCYAGMFDNCYSLTSLPNGMLPATTLASHCYAGMFEGCRGLTSVPSDLLPATTLAVGCYGYMFNFCTSLTTTLNLPATTLAERCYVGMFQECWSLTTAPELPATTLANWCYGSMFNTCKSLNYIKCLATDISASNCTFYWVYGVQTSSGTFVKASSMGSWTSGDSGIPTNWTVQNA